MRVIKERERRKREGWRGKEKKEKKRKENFSTVRKCTNSCTC